MKNNLLIAIAIGLLTATFISCFSYNKEIKGNRIIINERVNIADYHEIKIDGIAVFIYEQSDNDPYLTITTDQNIYQMLDISTKNGILYIRPAKDFIHLRPSKLIIHSHSKQLNEININGSCDFKIEGDLLTDKMEIKINGSGKVVFQDNLFADELSIDINGNGDIYVAGMVEQADYDINGNGIINAFKCETKSGDFDIAGNGKMEVSVQDRMNCEVAGNGSIFYKGNPRVIIEGSGKSRVRKVD